MVIYRLVLSAREILKEKEKEAMKEKMASIKIGSVTTGKVESASVHDPFDFDGKNGLFLHIRLHHVPWVGIVKMLF